MNPRATRPCSFPLPASPPVGLSHEYSKVSSVICSGGFKQDVNHSPATSAGKLNEGRTSSDDLADESDRRRIFLSGARKQVQHLSDLPKLEDFELIRVIGKGCAGKVLLVKHALTSKVHAMKAISKRAVLANDELDHTIVEQNILRHFSSRPCNGFIAHLESSFSDKENFYLLMDFYPGGDLATQMEIHTILGPLRTRFYACDITAGLEILHGEGIIVRDLKPENILLNRFGHAVLSDFGLSKSFGYRGDPVAVKLPEGYSLSRGTPTPYASKGFGTWRDGTLTWDRANSFVGTQEYLAPEVIKREYYSYAVDWWALGCIVCECLTGRVPFRRSEQDNLQEMYEYVLTVPWDVMYRQEQPMDYLRDCFGIDDVTIEFIDGKEPMFRLTEPTVRIHSYFDNIDWDIVESGGYSDPVPLQFDPNPGCNLRFFPRLCLEETPSVDMTDHDYGREPSPGVNPLNDDDEYALAQEKFHKILTSFNWVRPHESNEIDDWNRQNGANGHSFGHTAQQLDETNASSAEISMDTPTINAESLIDNNQSTDDSVAYHSSSVSFHINSSSTSSYDVNGKGQMQSALTTSILSEDANQEQAPAESLDQNKQGQMTPDLPGAPLIFSSADSVLNQVTDPAPMPSVPSSLPAGGLSVSDIVSYSSPVPGSPNLIIHRHCKMPSVETVPQARLSVELHGIITHLSDDDEWERLEGDGLFEAPNGTSPSPQGSFLTRGFGGVIGKKPSRLNLSPTKAAVTTNLNQTRPTLFTVRSIENTKRAFINFKGFPRPKRNGSTKVPPKQGQSRPPSPLGGADRNDPSEDGAEPVTLSQNNLINFQGERSTFFFRPRHKAQKEQIQLPVGKLDHDESESTSTLSSQNTTTQVPVPQIELIPIPDCTEHAL